ncbi:MAG: hypothetical protein Q4F11_01370 [Eubacteriales bacterium]|nr:hypothetical protein [Eubacteriales bacterium]
MENIDLTQTIDASVSSMLTAGGILLLSALIVMTVVIIKRWHGRFIPILLGAISYAMFVFIFANLVMSALILLPSFDMAFENNPTVYSVIYCGVSAIGFTVARVLVSHMLTERYERQGDVMLGGIGIGLGDAVLYGMTALSYVVMSMGIVNVGLEKLFEGMPAEEMASTYQTMEALFTTPAPVWLIYGINAVLDVVLCITLMIVVRGCIAKQLPLMWIFFSGLAQFFVSVPLQVVGSTSLTNVLLAFLVKVILFAAVEWYVHKILALQITYNED